MICKHCGSFLNTDEDEFTCSCEKSYEEDE